MRYGACFRVREYAENRLVLRIIRINIILWIILLVLSLGHVHTWQLTRGRWRDPRLRIGENITYIFPTMCSYLCLVAVQMLYR